MLLPSGESGPRVAVVLVAAGRGERAGDGPPKQYRPILGESAVTRCLRLLDACAAIGAIQPVIAPGDGRFADHAIRSARLLAPVGGGETRQASVRAGVEALARLSPDLVLVHDAARPFASPALLARAIAAAAAGGAAVPATDITDTIKRIDAAGRIAGTIDRDSLRAVQTPQAFRFDLLREAHRRAAMAGRADFTDDAALAEWAGHEVHVFEGEAGNFKLTRAEDFVAAERRLLADLADVRTGTGFDVHAFGDGDHAMLGGIAIPHSRGLAGHSDADVVLHALTDAVLGALGEGDIGHHFPPSDPKWKGAASDRFLAHAVALVRARGGLVAHLDATVICEAPRIGPHREAMRARIAEIAGLSLSRVSVKATTTERLGFAGRREGIAAMASATVRLPWGTA